MRVPEWSGQSRPWPVRAGEQYTGMDGGEARRATPPPGHNREWSAELERTVALLAADLDSPAPMPSRVERWRRVLFPSYGARANAADALVTLAEAARARRETTAVFGRSS